MRVLVAHQGRLTLADRPAPAVPGECLVRVTAAGICGTDLELLSGYAGFSGVPGHEFVGFVEQAGSADQSWMGRRVAGEITVGCGQCPDAGLRAGDIATSGRSSAFAAATAPSRSIFRFPRRTCTPFPDRSTT